MVVHIILVCTTQHTAVSAASHKPRAKSQEPERHTVACMIVALPIGVALEAALDERAAVQLNQLFLGLQTAFAVQTINILLRHSTTATHV